MKKAYEKPELDLTCFALNEDIVAASGGPSQSPLDWASGKFEQMEDGILDFLGNLGN